MTLLQVELDFEQQLLSQTHNFISSVYLDSNDFDCYHARIRQDEGAQLLRVRWYGGEIDDDARRRTTEVNHEKHLPGDPGGTAGAVPTPRVRQLRRTILPFTPFSQALAFFSFLITMLL